jgi:hypothetical protein
MSDPTSLTKTGLAKKLTQAVSYGLSGGWFTPEMPLNPQQQQTAGRRYDYLPGFNISTQPRRDSGIDFFQLRNLAGYYDILRIIIDKRKDQICSFDWSIVPSDAQVGVIPDDETKAKIDYVSEFLRTPDGRLSWSRWLRMLCEDYIVLDGIALWPIYEGKKLKRIETIDPATIKLVIDESGRRPEPPYPAYQQVLHGVPTSDYQKDELLYFISNPASNRLYGLSKVEQVVITIQIGLRREISQLQFFTEGNLPAAIVGVPDTWTPVQIAQLQQAFDAMLAGNTAERARLKFIPGDASKIMQLRSEEATLKAEFDEWIVRILCFNLGISPQPFTKQMNRATAQTAQEEARDEGLGPSLSFLKEVMDTIIHKALKVEGVEFKWNMEQDTDPATQATIDDTYIRNGTWSIDEVRQRQGLEATGMGNAVYLPTGPVPLKAFVDGTAPNLQVSVAPQAGKGNEPNKALPAPSGSSGGSAPGAPKTNGGAPASTPRGASAKPKALPNLNARQQPEDTKIKGGISAKFTKGGGAGSSRPFRRNPRIFKY